MVKKNFIRDTDIGEGGIYMWVVRSLMKKNGQMTKCVAIQRLCFIFSTALLILLISSSLYSAQTSQKEWEDFDRNNFECPAVINNEWMPLKPGTRFVYEGTTVEDGETIPHRVVINVTDLTKMIDGVCTVVTWDLDYSEDELVEAEIAFFAQDKKGNIWRMGEYPEEYEDGKIIDVPAWIHGLEDARAGISMKAKPRLGTPSYSQGWGPAVGFTDRGEIYQMGQKTKVPFGDYDDVLVIRESTKDEPNAYQLKYFARGIGNIRVGWMGGKEKKQEVLELVEVAQLDPKDLAEVRNGALKLEKSAYKNSKNLYGKTLPMEHSQVESVALKSNKPEATNQPTSKIMAEASKISEEEAVKIALKAVPGDVTAVSIEKKLGANRYVVEVIAKEDGVETDVIIDMETGKILTTEK
jgi:uncharacterized membrane protein YkoI